MCPRCASYRNSESCWVRYLNRIERLPFIMDGKLGYYRSILVTITVVTFSIDACQWKVYKRTMQRNAKTTKAHHVHVPWLRTHCKQVFMAKMDLGTRYCRNILTISKIEFARRKLMQKILFWSCSWWNSLQAFQFPLLCVVDFSLQLFLESSFGFFSFMRRGARKICIMRW